MSNWKRNIFDGVNFAILGSVLLVVVLKPSDEDLLNLKQNASLFLTLIFFGVILSPIINANVGKSLGEHLFEPAFRKAQHEQKPLLKTFWGWQLLVSFVVMLAVGIQQTSFSLYELFDANGFDAAMNLFRGMLSPNWNLLPTAVLKVIETIFIAFMATVIAIPIAFLLAFFSAKNLMKGPLAFPVYGILRAALNVTRSIEPIIWAIVFSTWVGIGPFAGMMALMIHSVASLTKQYSEIVESVSEGPIEGIASTGANTIQTVWFAIVPQVILPYISFTIYRWDINVRMATIIGFAGGGGIGTILNQHSMRSQWPEVGCLVIVIAAVVWIMDMTSAYVREALK